MALKIIVFGASGNVGTAAVESALQAGHQVTAFIHHTPLSGHLTDKVPHSHRLSLGLSIVDGSLSTNGTSYV